METKNKCISAEAKEVIAMLSRKLGVDITDKSRKRNTTTARFVAFYWLRKMGYTCTEVAEMFGMHHSTVSYGVQEVDDFLSIGDKTVREMCDTLRCLDVRDRGYMDLRKITEAQ
jgi:chromosomal replication initiation ATPase DnaA